MSEPDYFVMQVGSRWRVVRHAPGVPREAFWLIEVADCPTARLAQMLCESHNRQAVLDRDLRSFGVRAT